MEPTTKTGEPRERGFTLIELLIVVAIIGILSSMAVVQLRQTPQRAKEAALRENLYVLRNCIDQYFTDKGKYPDSLKTLVDDGYVRRVPIDPITGSDATWIENPADTGTDGGAGGTGDEPGGGGGGGIGDVHSGATGTALDGSTYGDW